MNLRIAEIRLPEVDDAVLFLGGCGCEIDRGYVQHTLSLIARDEMGEIRGVAMCAGIEGKPHTKLLVGCSEGIDEDAIQEITNKAIMKLHAVKMSKFKILLYGSIKGQTFWPRNNWLIHLDETDQVSIDDYDVNDKADSRSLVA
ncbi:hypothetical protein KS4_33730 [Poriferisphaera corsica]|uniref:Uncharacterized protein n=1 Tax=Poriferisphaera corsica TaxID=2528020 RepID=A0A517YYI5_9BACT|nr:hypothetical protein [Poriferisphaera corsica]QDU35292.1 hypothetical protein KS4_33730 [Poriferisphaera corsica]